MAPPCACPHQDAPLPRQHRDATTGSLGLDSEPLDALCGKYCEEARPEIPSLRPRPWITKVKSPGALARAWAPRL
eukprot:470270-Alexandrium_andersonii.AAC.1